jgi:type VI secretion system secreted protein Hcp
MAYNVYLKLAGVTGDCADERRKGWIEIDSFSQSLHRAGPEPEAPSQHDLNIARMADASTPVLARACAEGRHFPEAVIEFCRREGGREVFLELRLTDVQIQSYSLSGGPAGDVRAPYENLFVRVGKVEWVSRTEGGAVSATWVSRELATR